MLTITVYKITASVHRFDRIFDCSTAEYLGDACKVTYLTRSDVDTEIARLSSSVEEYDLDPTTSYSAVESTITVTDIATTTEEDGRILVSAHVTMSGWAGTTLWSAQPHHTAAGVDGLEPCGDSIGAWTDGDMALLLDTPTLVHVGLEILAMARSGA